MARAPKTRILLLISEAAADKGLIFEALSETTRKSWRVEQAFRLSDAIKQLSENRINLVLLDLFLPDIRGIKTFMAIFNRAPLVPILLLADRRHETLARRAIRSGAQDYILRDHLDSYWLPRTLASAVERKARETASVKKMEHAQSTLDSIGDAVICTDLKGKVTYLNRFAEHLTGSAYNQALGRPLAEIYKTSDALAAEDAADPMAQGGKEKNIALTQNCTLIGGDGVEYSIEHSISKLHNRAGKKTGAVMVLRDVSATRAILKKITHLAQHDFLTDLPNRMVIIDRIENAIALARRHGKQGALLFVDLDRLKYINDSLGHPMGDKLLQLVAQRLVASVRASDTVSRQGGDEFLVLLSEIEHAHDAAIAAEKLMQSLAAPYTEIDLDMHVTASIGISIFPNHGEDAAILVRRADTAMYQAKAKGRNTYQFFTQDISIRAVQR